MLKNYHLLIFFLLSFASIFLLTGDSLIALLISVSIILTLISIGLFNIQLNLFLKSISRLKTTKKIVFLTFDDGPSPSNTIKILETLKANDLKAIFFCIGAKAKEQPNIVKRIINDGHLIGGHTLHHKWEYAFYNQKRIINEIDKGNDIIKQIAGQEVALFRPPWGITNPRIAFAIKALNLKSIGWSIRSLDTVFKNKQRINDRIINKLKPGRIILLHDSLDITAEILPELIVNIKSKGYSIGSYEEYIK